MSGRWWRARGGTLRTLHVDIEGGWGGSSRSLFQLVSRLDRTRVSPLVVHRQEGPAQEWYASLGIRTIHVPEIGSFVPRVKKAAKNFLASLPRLAKQERTAQLIAGVIADNHIEVIHWNYEGLFFLAGKVRARCRVPAIGHFRTLLPSDQWGRWLAQRYVRANDYLLYISPQEKRRVEEIAPLSKGMGEVFWNIAPPSPDRRPLGDPPSVVYFGTLDWTKGVDRLLDVAAILEAGQAPPLRIDIYGVARTDRCFAERLAADVKNRELSNRVRLMGYCHDPMVKMAGSLALIRPSRDNDPWGRDLIEAAACGLPAIATGSFDGCVRDGQTGVLLPEFDAQRVAEILCYLLASTEAWNTMSAAARRHAMRLFNGQGQASRFIEIAETLAAQSAGTVVGTRREILKGKEE